MASNSEEFKIPKLSSDNYHAWAIRAKAALIHKDCWIAIEPGFGVAMTADEVKSNNKALSFLFLVVEDTYLDDIGECVRAQEAWKNLEEINTKHGLLHILQLMKELFNVRMKPNENMKVYLGRIAELHRKLAKCGYGFNDKEFSCMMLLGLPTQYEPLILNLEHNEATLNTKEVKAKLLLEEKRLLGRLELESKEDEAKALYTKVAGNFGKANTNNRVQPKNKYNNSFKSETHKRARNIRCFCCGEMGDHIAKNCPLNKTDDEEAKASENRRKANRATKRPNHRAFLAKYPSVSDPNTWLLDSGSTDHMTSFREKLQILGRINPLWKQRTVKI